VVGGEAGRTEVNHFDLTPGEGLDEDVLWLEVAVDEVEGVDISEAF
jgi:predicted RNA-binding protein